jgi:hypothetical protein
MQGTGSTIKSFKLVVCDTTPHQMKQQNYTSASNHLKQQYIHKTNIHNFNLWYISITQNPFSENQETAP